MFLCCLAGSDKHSLRYHIWSLSILFLALFPELSSGNHELNIFALPYIAFYCDVSALEPN